MERTALLLLLASGLASAGAAALPAGAERGAAFARAAWAASVSIDGPYELYSRGPHS